jgi:hypothetical protein
LAGGFCADAALAAIIAAQKNKIERFIGSPPKKCFLSARNISGRNKFPLPKKSERAFFGGGSNGRRQWPARRRSELFASSPIVTVIFRGSDVHSFKMLAIESTGVISLRMMKLMSGGSDTLSEAELMISEKIDAAFETAASLMTGVSADEIVQRYRQRVGANAARLARNKFSERV